MVSGVALDALLGGGGAIWPRTLGVMLILAGIWLAQRSKRPAR